MISQVKHRSQWIESRRNRHCSTAVGAKNSTAGQFAEEHSPLFFYSQPISLNFNPIELFRMERLQQNDWMLV